MPDAGGLTSPVRRRSAAHISPSEDGAAQVGHTPEADAVATAHPPITANATSPDSGAQPARRSERRNETILVVDDESEIRRLARRALERQGYQVLDASNGREALALLDARGPSIDLVLTDVVMPVMDGTELMTEVRGRGSRLPFLFMSGYTGERLDTLAEVTVLPKPWALADLTDAVRRVLDDAASRPEAAT